MSTGLERYLALPNLVGLSLILCLGCGRPTSPSSPEKPEPLSGTSAQPSEPVLEAALDLPEETAAKEADPSKPGAMELKPELTWSLFAKAWNEHDEAGLKAFRSQHGLILLDNPGAFVRLTRIPGPAGVSELEGHFDRARLKSVRLELKLSEGEPPENDCSSDAIDRGTYQASPKRLRLKERWQALGRYELSSPLEIEDLRAAVDNAEQHGRFAVYDLANHVGFLFGQEGRSLVLLAIDAVVPCSA